MTRADMVTKLKKSLLAGGGCKLALAVAFASFAAMSETIHTAADGSTFDVTGGTLTITVPSGKTQSSYDYVANILNNSSYAITEIVKEGAGILSARSASSYTGAWTVNAGSVKCSADYSLGSVSGSADSKGAVTVRSGACIQLDRNLVNLVNNRCMVIEGNGDSANYSGNPAAIYCSQGTSTYIAGSTLALAGDARTWGPLNLGSSSVIDVNGHNLGISGNQWSYYYFKNGVVVTNSSASGGAVTLTTSPNYKVVIRSSVWRGGDANTLDVNGSGRLYVEGNVDTDWTVKLKGPVRGGVQTKTPQTARNSYRLKASSIVVNGSVNICNPDGSKMSNNDYSYEPGFGLALDGEITGNASSSLSINYGAWVSFEGASSTFQGSFALGGRYDQNADPTYRCAAYFQAGAPFVTTADKTVSIKDSDIWMDPTTVRSISSLSITKGKSTITGSAAGSTIPAITVTGGATNILDTPAAIATYTLTNGRLVFGGTPPAISNLVYADDQVIDLNGKNVFVDTFTYRSARFENPGTMTITNLVIDFISEPVVVPACLVAGGSAPITVTQGGGDLPAIRCVAAYFAPGATLPDVSRFTGTVPAGMTVAFALESVASGEHAGYTALVAEAGPATAVEAETITDADGTTFECTNRVLTVTVPEGITNSYDYSSLVAAHYVTNIVKMGGGSLTARAMTTYAGDFTINEGYFYFRVAGDLGRERFGTVRVANGGGLAVGDWPATSAIRYKTIYLGGNGPDGRGVLRGASAGSTAYYMRDMTFILTGDAKFAAKVGPEIEYDYFDFAGHTLTIRSTGSWAQLGKFKGCVMTNSVPGTEGKVRVLAEEGGYFPKLQLDGPTSWVGGTNNILSVTTRAYMGKCDGDWTISFDANGAPVWGTWSETGNPFKTDLNYFKGPILLRNNGSFGPPDNVLTNKNNSTSKASPLSIYGPICGAADRTLSICIPFHIFSTEHHFEGTVAINNSNLDPRLMNPPFRGIVYLHDGAAFPGGAGKTVTVNDTDLWLGTNTAFRLQAFKHTANAMGVYGGPRGDSACGRAVFKSFEKAGAGILTFDSPAIVAGDMAVTGGTLALGTNMPEHVRTAAELPVFSNLVFSAGTTFDMNGNAIEVPNFAGAPALADAAALTIGESLTARGAEIAGGATLASTSALTFVDGAVVRLSGAATLLRSTTYTLCSATGGITLPDGNEIPVETDLSANDWHAVLSADGKSLELVYVPQGTVLIVR